MKEIGMEKLIALLNEYLNDKVGYIQYHNKYGFKRTPTKSAVEGDRMLQDEYVLGKSFGFIKWLVENDKIDFSREGEYSTKSIEEFDGLLRDNEDGLIMILSIQDEPIRFLCEILK